MGGFFVATKTRTARLYGKLEVIKMENKIGEKKWFRVKRYGFGWTPSTWQGWAVILLYVFIMIFGVNRIVTLADDSQLVGISISLFLIPLTAVLILICYIKGEKPGWHWGKDK